MEEAVKGVGITRPKASDVMHGGFSNFSARKLMECPTRLGYYIEIEVRFA